MGTPVGRRFTIASLIIGDASPASRPPTPDAKLCAQTAASDIVDVSVVVCARERGHSIITSDPDDLHAIDPAVVLRRPD